MARTEEFGDKTLTATFAPLQVMIKDSRGKPLKNVRVLFHPYQTDPTQGPAVQITANCTKLVYVMTDKHGIATLSLMHNYSTFDRSREDKLKRNVSVHCYYEDGPFSIIATYGETKVRFNLITG